MSTEAEIQYQPMNYGTWSQFLKRSVAPEFEPRARRQFHRYPFQASAKAVFQIEDKSYKRTWRILEVSLGGAMAKTHEPVALDTRVTLHLELETGWFSLQAVVMHSTQTLGGYKIGLQLVFPEADAPDVG